MSTGTSDFGRMPANVAEIYAALWQDVGNLDLYWKGYCQLYAKNPERIELLRRVACLFFGQVQQAMFRDILLRICHLTDKSVTNDGHHRNQSLYRLLDEVKAHDPTLMDKLGLLAKAGALKSTCGAIRILRNRVIAHRDWDARKGPLPSTNSQEMGSAIALIQEIMNTVAVHFGCARTLYGFEGDLGEAETLVNRLEDLARRLDEEWTAKGLPNNPWHGLAPVRDPRRS
jgi:hypothetical protein